MRMKLTKDEMEVPVQFKGGPGSGQRGHRTSRGSSALHQATRHADDASARARIHDDRINRHGGTVANYTAAAGAHAEAARLHQTALKVNPANHAHHVAHIDKHQRAAEEYAQMATKPSSHSIAATRAAASAAAMTESEKAHALSRDANTPEKDMAASDAHERAARFHAAASEAAYAIGDKAALKLHMEMHADHRELMRAHYQRAKGKG